MTTSRLARAFRSLLSLRSFAFASALGAAVFGAGPAGAKEVETGLSGTVSFEEGYTDNVRADAVRRAEAWFSTFEGEAVWQRKPRGWLPHRIGGLMRYRVYSDFPNRDYAQFGPAFGYDFKHVSLTLSYDYSPDHLRVDPSEAIDAFADVHNLVAEARSKFGPKKMWTAIFALHTSWEFYDKAFRERSFFQEKVEAGLRCRATEHITPRASVTFSERDAIAMNFDREDVALNFGFDAYLPWGIRGLFRYERKWRNFLVGYPTKPTGGRNNNFGREDDVGVYGVGLDIPVPRTESTTLQLRYDYEDNNSTRRDRSYHSNEASVRLSYDFD